MNTLKDVLNYIDEVIISDKYKRSYVENLENIRHYIINKTDKNKIIMLDVLSNMNNIIEKFYDDSLINFVSEYKSLRICVLIWADAMIDHI